MYSIINTPEKLTRLAQPPKSLYLRGSLPTNMPTVAIVGSRHASSEGKETAYSIAKQLASFGVVIISGLAVGIDSSAHEGTLSVGGQTIAVLPSGIETIYPASNRQLAERILQAGGGLISEYPGTRTPRKQDFLARNRIIAGLSDLVIIVEAASRSGALNTARHAIENNTTLMAVPGSIYNHLSNGCNNLIRQGAIIYTEISDVWLALNIEQPKQQNRLVYSPEHQEIIERLKGTSLTVEKLSQELNWQMARLQPELTKLELEGVLIRVPGNRLKLL